MLVKIIQETFKANIHLFKITQERKWMFRIGQQYILLFNNTESGIRGVRTNDLSLDSYRVGCLVGQLEQKVGK